MAELYPVLRDAHYWLSRIGLLAGVIMLVIAIYIGLIRHGDVTRWFRYGVYAITIVIAIECLIGLIMYIQGGRPHDEVHIIYGVGALLALPFFVFVETTAKKRPAMGSYIWGFSLMVGIFVRAIMTGAMS
jgi:heme A synthase